MNKASAESLREEGKKALSRCDFKTAFARFEEAATLGDAEAMVRLGECCRDGIGTRRACKKARKWFVEAAKRGNAEGAFNAGEDFRGTGDEISAEKYFLKADELGHTFAAGALADIYFKRTRTDPKERSDPRAFPWAKKGADAGDVKAMLTLADCYRYRVGTNADKKKELEWNLKAEERGNAEGAFRVGRHFRNSGEIEKAIAHFAKAVELGHDYAATELTRIYSSRNPPDPEAFKWAKKALEVGQDVAMTWIRCGYYSYHSAPGKDMEKAREWRLKIKELKASAREAEKRGNAADVSKVVKKSRKSKATKSLREKSVQKMLQNIEKQALAMDIYIEGKKARSRRDFKTAFARFEEAAALGEVRAMVSLGECFRDGVGTEVDEEKAREWFFKAEKRGMKTPHPFEQ